MKRRNGNWKGVAIRSLGIFTIPLCYWTQIYVGSDIHAIRFLISLCCTVMCVSQYRECKVDYGVFTCFMSIAIITTFYVHFPTLADMWFCYGIITLLIILKAFLLPTNDWFMLNYVKGIYVWRESRSIYLFFFLFLLLFPKMDVSFNIYITFNSLCLWTLQKIIKENSIYTCEFVVAMALVSTFGAVSRFRVSFGLF